MNRRRKRTVLLLALVCVGTISVAGGYALRSQYRNRLHTAVRQADSGRVEQLIAERADLNARSTDSFFLGKIFPSPRGSTARAPNPRDGSALAS